MAAIRGEGVVPLRAHMLEGRPQEQTVEGKAFCVDTHQPNPAPAGHSVASRSKSGQPINARGHDHLNMPLNGTMYQAPVEIELANTNEPF